MSGYHDNLDDNQIWVITCNVSFGKIGQRRFNCKINLKKRAKIMIYTKHVVSDPNIMLGKPIIKGTRITVEIILRKMSEGMTTDELLSSYPHLTKEDILAAISYSADVISKEELIAL
jgi:uncharacterized protein (DUF433 family)